MVLASFWMLEVREFGVLKVWLSKLVELLLVKLASDLSVQLVGSMLCMVGNSLDDTLQAIAVLETNTVVMTAVVSNSSLLLVDEVLDLSELAPEVI